MQWKSLSNSKPQLSAGAVTPKSQITVVRLSSDLEVQDLLVKISPGFYKWLGSPLISFTSFWYVNDYMQRDLHHYGCSLRQIERATTPTSPFPAAQNWGCPSFNNDHRKRKTGQGGERKTFKFETKLKKLQPLPRVGEKKGKKKKKALNNL